MKWFNQFSMWGESVEVDSPEEVADMLCEVCFYTRDEETGCVQLLHEDEDDSWPPPSTLSFAEQTWKAGLADLANADGWVEWDDFVAHVKSGLRCELSRRYFAEDDGGGETDLGEHKSLDAALEAAEKAWEGIEYGDLPRSIVEVAVWNEDTPNERHYVEVEVGSDPDEPECSDERGHRWDTYGEWPCWQLADGCVCTDEKCTRCGCLRMTTTASPAGQKPWYPVRVEYPEPFEED